MAACGDGILRDDLRPGSKVMKPAMTVTGTTPTAAPTTASEHAAVMVFCGVTYPPERRDTKPAMTATWWIRTPVAPPAFRRVVTESGVLTFGRVT